jgi:exopolysaccharide biosynthesis protein
MKNCSITTFVIMTSMLIMSCAKPNEGGEAPAQPENAPKIISVSSKFNGKAVYGYPIVIKGKNFSTQPGGNVVMFGKETVKELIDFSATEITVVVPRISGYNSRLKVVSDGVESNEESLKYDQHKCDSVVIFEKATVEKIREGIVWTSTITTWLGEPRSLNVVSIKPSDVNKIGIHYQSKYGTATSSQAKSLGAVAAINAAYYGGTAHDGFVRVDGVDKVQGGRDCSSFFANGAFIIDDNVPAVCAVNGNAGAAALSSKNVVGSGPLLVMDGNVQAVNNTSAHNTDPHPRTAIGVTKDGRVLFVTVDGRFPGLAIGMSSELLAKYMKILGAHAAVNLDGGGSTTLWIKDKGVVNHTSQGGTGSWNSPQERSVGSIIYVK